MEPKSLSVVHYVPHWLTITENWIYSQVKYLPAFIENHIVTSHRPQNLHQFPWPQIHTLPAQFLWEGLTSLGAKENIVRKVGRKLQTMASQRFLARIIQQHDITLIHSHFGYNGWAMMSAVKQTNAKHVVTFYGQDVTRYPQVDPRWHGRYHDLFTHVDAVLCEGPFMGQSIVDLGCPPEKVRVHHLGVRVDEIAFRPRSWRPGDPLRVLMAASFREKKGLPYGLEALGRLKDDLPLEITIIGDANSAERSQAEKQKILETIKQQQLEDQVCLLGYQPHGRLMTEAYNHHVFLSPSVTASDGDTEGGAPVAIIEMVASGMPIVSTTHCDIPGVVQPGLRPLLAAEREVDGLVAALRWLIDHHGQWPQILHEGRRYIETEFDVRRQGKRLANIYTEVVERETQL